MKEYLAELVRQTPTPQQGRNLAREYLQAHILAAAEPGLTQQCPGANRVAGGVIIESNWRKLVCERLRRLDWSGIQADVSPFVEPGFDPGLLTLENLERVLGED
jgi:hypothetical protein